MTANSTDVNGFDHKTRPSFREDSFGGVLAKPRASGGYRMRMLTLELWNKWPKIRLHLRRPELGLDGTNNASERAIGRSKVRYKTMRGYKSDEGMSNGVVLTQWLYSGEDEHDLAEVMAA